MKLYQVQFEDHLEKTYYVVERDPEKALLRVFPRAVNDVLATEPAVRVYPPPGQLGAGEVMELCDAKDLILDILDALGDDEEKPENPNKVVDSGSR